MTQRIIGSEEIEIPIGSPWERFIYHICVGVAEKMIILNMQQTQSTPY